MTSPSIQKPLQTNFNLSNIEASTNASLAPKKSQVASESTTAQTPLGVYEGTLYNSEFHGHGKLTYTNGDTYEGAWVNGVRYGAGVYTTAEGFVTQGEWIDDELSGNVLMSENGITRFQGQVKNGKYEGFGTEITDGYTFQGAFKEHQRHGTGTRRYPDGTLIESTWENDEVVGNETIRYLNGLTVVAPHPRAHKPYPRVVTFPNGDILRINKVAGEMRLTFLPSKDIGVSSKWQNNFHSCDPYSAPRPGKVIGTTGLFKGNTGNGDQYLSLLGDAITQQQNLMDSTEPALQMLKYTTINLTRPDSGLAAGDVLRLALAIGSLAPPLERMDLGSMLRMKKEAKSNNTNWPPRSLVVYKHSVSGMHLFILCKQNVTGADGTTTKEKSRIIDTKVGETAKLVYEWIHEKAFMQITSLHDPEKEDIGSCIVKFEKKMEYTNMFAGMRGFAESKALGVHFDTKKSKVDGKVYFKTSYFTPHLSEGTLAKFCNDLWMSGKSLNEKVRLEWLEDLAAALKAMHEKKVVHGNLTHDNIRIDNNMRQKLVVTNFSNAETSDKAFTLGSPAFMSPERLFYTPQLATNTMATSFLAKHTHAVDMWSAGLCYLELLASGSVALTTRLKSFRDMMEKYKNPHHMESESFYDFSKLISKELTQLFSLFPQSQELVIARRMLAVDPSERLTPYDLGLSIANLKTAQKKEKAKEIKEIIHHEIMVESAVNEGMRTYDPKTQKVNF